MWFSTSVVLVVLFAKHKVQAGNSIVEISLKSCRNIFTDENFKRQCCRNLHNLVVTDPSEQQCGTSKQMKCEQVECVLKKLGIMNNGTINYERVKEKNVEFVKSYGWAKNWLEKIEEECTQTTFDSMPGSMCLAIKYHICTVTMAMLECPHWRKDDGVCKILASRAKDCKDTVKKQREIYQSNHQDFMWSTDPAILSVRVFEPSKASDMANVTTEKINLHV